MLGCRVGDICHVVEGAITTRAATWALNSGNSIQSVAAHMKSVRGITPRCNFRVVYGMRWYCMLGVI